MISIKDFFIRHRIAREQKLVNFDSFDVGDQIQDQSIENASVEIITKIDKANDEIVTISKSGSIEGHLSSGSFLYGGYTKLEE
jgi:hypothetical protein